MQLMICHFEWNSAFLISFQGLWFRETPSLVCFVCFAPTPFSFLFKLVLCHCAFTFLFTCTILHVFFYIEPVNLRPCCKHNAASCISGQSACGAAPGEANCECRRQGKYSDTFTEVPYNELGMRIWVQLGRDDEDWKLTQEVETRSANRNQWDVKCQCNEYFGRLNNVGGRSCDVGLTVLFFTKK